TTCRLLFRGRTAAGRSPGNIRQRPVQVAYRTGKNERPAARKQRSGVSGQGSEGRQATPGFGCLPLTPAPCLLPPAPRSRRQPDVLGAVERERLAERVDLPPHGRPLALVAGVREDAVDEGDDLAEVVGAEAARGHGRAADADAARDERALGVVGHHVLVDGDVGLAEERLGLLPREPLAPEVDEAEVV